MEAIDRDTFRQIFEDHWNEFKERHQVYAGEHYEEVVQKMLGCGIGESHETALDKALSICKDRVHGKFLQRS